jgi:hypothetical protein
LAKALFKHRLLAVALLDGEKIARLRCGGEGHKINLITSKRVNQP